MQPPERKVEPSSRANYRIASLPLRQRGLDTRRQSDCWLVLRIDGLSELEGQYLSQQ